MALPKETVLGTRYGRMRVVASVGKDKHGIKMVLCRCDCGVEKTVRRGDLNSGKIVSCGCHARDRVIKRCTTHGLTGTPTHKSWIKMRERCLIPSCREFRYWGGRGIKIDPRWDDFAVFLADVGERPSLAHSLDRWPDHNGNYEPGNVRWATDKEQGRNKRNNILVEFDGKSVTVAEWAELLGFRYAVLYTRLFKLGWDTRRAFTTPLAVKYRTRSYHVTKEQP